MKRIVGILLASLLCGCIAVDQEWVHANKPYSDGSNYHRLVPGHIRWYQYERHFWNLGGKPPAFMGGIWYTITTPSDWFWYGPYKLSTKDQFYQYWKRDCLGCKYSFEALINAINDRKKIIDELDDTPENLEKKRTLQSQIDVMGSNNFLDNDYSTPFEKRFE